MKENNARVIAFYLPQFHPIPENDNWWGTGFTEWTNVTKAKPLFADHAQPKFPSDLGYYDLRVSEVREKQADMARDCGVEGFCYWHYWFAGDRLLERPFQEVLDSGKPDFPFCLGWANETWSGVWHGAPNKILIEQTYPGQEDDFNHFQYLLKAFTDKRYIRINNCPMFLVYKPLKMKDAKSRFDYWRQLAIDAGLDGLYIVGVSMQDIDDPSLHGLDGIVISNLGVTSGNEKISKFKRIYWGLRRRSPIGSLRIMSYKKAIKFLIPDSIKKSLDEFPCIVPNWDNTPRSGSRGLVLTGSTPELFQGHVKEAVQSVENREKDKKIIFLKSWNEWAEGNYMEPDTTWGWKYMDALKSIIKK